MEPKDFTKNIAKEVIKLWDEHLGRWYKRVIELDYPEILAEDVQHPERWFAGRYQPRVGSRYTDDSKLLISLNLDGNLLIESYVQSHTIFGEDRKEEADRAEEAFNQAVMNYINSVKNS